MDLLGEGFRRLLSRGSARRDEADDPDDVDPLAAEAAQELAVLVNLAIRYFTGDKRR